MPIICASQITTGRGPQGVVRRHMGQIGQTQGDGGVENAGGGIKGIGLHGVAKPTIAIATGHEAGDGRCKRCGGVNQPGEEGAGQRRTVAGQPVTGADDGPRHGGGIGGGEQRFGHGDKSGLAGAQ